MSVADAGKNPLRCRQCGRGVNETMHTRSACRVDYYSLHTGDAEPVTMTRDDDTPITVLRVVRPVEIVTCVDCYRRPTVREARELLFRPEMAAQVDQEAAGG